AVHARHDLDVDGATLRGGAGTGGIADGIALGVLDPKILRGTHQALRYIIANPARERVVAGRADLMVRSDDDTTDLRIGILAARGDDLTDLEIVLVPPWNGSHDFRRVPHWG